MKRHIRASRKDDLIREQQQWKMRHDARQVLYDEQEGRYDKAKWDWKDSVANLVRSTFSSYINKLPDLDIRVDNYYYGSGGIEIRMQYEHLFNESFSLNWSYDIAMNNKGDIKKETSSWSGFNAVTPVQIDDLMNSANFLKAIVDFDWAPLLNEAKASVPKYSQYVGIRNPNSDPDYKDPGYDKMIKEAEIEDALNSDMWIKIDSDWGTGRWVYIISETPKFYTYTSIGDWDITHATPENSNIESLRAHITDPKNASSYYIDRIKKDKLRFKNPIETKTPEELIAMIGTAVR